LVSAAGPDWSGENGAIAADCPADNTVVIFYQSLGLSDLRRERGRVPSISSSKGRIVSDVAKIDRMLDETLVNLVAMVLRLADPEVTRTVD